MTKPARARCALPNSPAAHSCGKKASNAFRLWSNCPRCFPRPSTSWKTRTPKRTCACCSRRDRRSGARPKASVIEKDGQLAIAKFPRKDDDFNTVVWEAVALALAHKAGIAVPEARVETISKKPVLLLRRFDRAVKRRIPFLSAMSMLGSRDNETRSYLEIVDALRQHGAAPKADMEALWRRLVFNVLISNTDDHLRNHGFLYAGQEGWRLSPAYDMNPVPTDIKPRILSTAINEDDNTASLALALEVAGYFDLDDAKAREIAKQVGNAVSKWRDEATRRGLTKNAIDRMASAFEHEDLKAALGK